MKIKEMLNNKVVKIILSIILGILIMYNIIFVINEIVTDKNYISICGLNISIMQDDTMKGTIGKNALVFSINKDISSIKENDIITIKNNSNLKLRRVTKVINSNDIQFVIKGDNNYFNDVQYISKESYEGKIFFSIPVIGIIFKVFQSKIITIIALFLTIYVLNMLKNKEKRRQKTRKIRKNIRKEKE